MHIGASHIVRASGIMRHALLNAERPVSRIGTLRMCIVHRAWTCRGTHAIAALSHTAIGVAYHERHQQPWPEIVIKEGTADCVYVSAEIGM